MGDKTSRHYRIVSDFYMGDVAVRSGIPKIFHIKEGLILLEHLGASDVVKSAWCIHPVVQSNEDFKRELVDHRLSQADSDAIIMAMEYRFIANSYLSKDVDIVTLKHTKLLGDKLNGFYKKDIRLMLIADKVQNYKDFKNQPKGTYENEKELQIYFASWLFDILKLGPNEHQKLEGLIS